MVSGQFNGKSLRFEKTKFLLRYKNIINNYLTMNNDWKSLKIIYVHCGEEMRYKRSSQL